MFFEDFKIYSRLRARVCTGFMRPSPRCQWTDRSLADPADFRNITTFYEKNPQYLMNTLYVRPIGPGQSLGPSSPVVIWQLELDCLEAKGPVSSNIQSLP